MSNAALAPLTAAELAERKAFLARLKTDFPQRDATSFRCAAILACGRSLTMATPRPPPSTT